MIFLYALIVALLALLPQDIDDQGCYEDEVVVVFVQGWTGTHHEQGRATGSFYCAPWDDMRPVTTTNAWQLCERFGFRTSDLGLAQCGDFFDWPCGDPYTDPLRAGC